MKAGRKIDCEYLTLGFKYPAASFAVQTSLMIKVWLVESNIGGDVPMMSYEKFIVSEPEVRPSSRCEPDVLKGIIQCRLDAEEFLASEELAEVSLVDISKLLARRRGTWIARDPQFGVDIFVLTNIGGEAGIAHVKKLAMNTFPGPGVLESRHWRGSPAPPLRLWCGLASK